jgi:hypothetical protein
VRLREGRYDPSQFRGGFACWLRLQARTVALNGRRHRARAAQRPTLARQFAVVDEDTGETADEHVPDHRGAAVPDHEGQEQRLGRVRAAVARLPGRMARAVRLYYGLGGGEPRSYARIDPAVRMDTNPIPHHDRGVRLGDEPGVAALRGQLVDTVAFEVEGVGNELEPALNRVAGGECVGAASAAGEDHDVG